MKLRPLPQPFELEALPASLEQLEERRVGPTLGSDSINKAKMGSDV